MRNYIEYCLISCMSVYLDRYLRWVSIYKKKKTHTKRRSNTYFDSLHEDDLLKEHPFVKSKYHSAS